MDADAIGCDNADTCVQPGTVRDDLITEEGNSGSDAVPQLTSLSHDQGFCLRVDDFESKRLLSEHETIISCHEAPLPGESQVNRGLRDSPPSSVCWLLLCLTSYVFNHEIDYEVLLCFV